MWFVSYNVSGGRIYNVGVPEGERVLTNEEYDIYTFNWRITVY